MEWHDVQRRIVAGEDARTEFKRKLGDLRGVGRTVCAFANGDGGVIVIGVDDAGAVVGDGENAETVQKRLASFLETGCGKPVTAACGTYETEGGWVHWIDVHRQQRGYEPFSCDGRFWIRRGRSTGAPSPSELQELLNTFGLVLTEKQVNPSATVDDMDFGAVRAFMRAQGFDPDGTPQPAREDDLRNGSIVDELDGVPRPTLYGVMVFGRDPQACPHTEPVRAVHGVRGYGPGGRGAGRGRRQGPIAEPSATGDGVVPQSRSQGDVWGHRAHRPFAGAGGGASGGAGQRHHPPRLRHHRVAGAAGGVRRPHRGDECRRIAESHDRRSGAQERRAAVAQRDDGECDGRRRAHGAARAGLADDAARHAALQRNRARAGQRRA